MSRRYAVLGTGAVGGFYGARLAAAGQPVHFVGLSDFDHSRRHGLLVESPLGDVRLPRPSVHRDTNDLPECDVVLVAVKTTENAALPELLGPLLGEGTVVVLLQNGLGNEEDLPPHLGDRPLIGGLCFLCSNKVGPGHVRHLDYGLVTLAQHAGGGRPAGVTQAVRQVGADLERAGVPVKAEDDLVLARWRKLVWNVPFNGLSVLLDALPQELLAHPRSRVLVQELMTEVQAGAAACGRDIPDSFLQKMVDHTEAMKPYLTSMKLDYDRAAALEIEFILARPARAAREAGVTLPRVEALHDQLAFLDARNRAARGR